MPVTISNGVTRNTVDPARLKTFVDANVDFGSSVTGTPSCAITVYTLKYRTLNSTAADTEASTAIYVHSGTDAACQGGRPVMLYAHGTSVQKSYDMSQLTSSEPRLIAALFAAQGYIVVAPNYVGYAGSNAGYHPYLDAEQQSADMIDALRAARSVFGSISASASSRLMVTGYSQGGFVAMATQRAMQTKLASEFALTAAAPLSGPYALTQFGDGIFNGAPTTGSAGFMPMLITNTTATADYFRAQNVAGLNLTVLNVDDSALSGPYLSTRAQFAAVK